LLKYYPGGWKEQKTPPAAADGEGKEKRFMKPGY